jgi:prepilin-type N-terminal cleavage/methylation domain-containing protein
MKHTTRNVPRGGFTLVEMSIALVILMVLAGSLTQTSRALKGITITGSTQEALQENAVRAMRSIVDDLRRSGDLADYPYLFLDGEADGGFNVHDHAPATKTAVAGEPDFGSNREIVFLLPADADGNGVPDIDANGALEWDPTELSYVVVTDAEGINVLQRRVDGANPRTIARHVERIVFDDSTTAAMNEVPPFAVRVRLFLRMRDDQGTVHRYSTESVVQLRNG